ncbi:glycosyltransferase [Paenibacillus alvei]|uniref:glycosyltransferase n=1 Tax=Paenibacillus alvei TaxID=44250 RepID=UPI00227E85B6|nr:glycosyltransferase [Paenibacillus alvei]
MKINIDGYKFNRGYLMKLYEYLIANDTKHNTRLLASIKERIRLLGYIYKCSDEISEFLTGDDSSIDLCQENSSCMLDAIENNLEIKPLKISVNIITYNEERCIKRCIDSIKCLADEILVLDTGSNDNTVSIIEGEYPQVKLFQCKWGDDFSAARNKLINMSTGDWIFQIDADEYLVSSIADVRNFLGMFNDFPELMTVISPKVINHDNSELLLSKRMFKKESGLKYYGIIHEELRSSDIHKRGEDISHIGSEFVLKHDGYRKEIVSKKKKLERNKNLLEKMIEIEPDNIRWHYFLAREKRGLKESNEQILQILSNGIKFKGYNKDLDHFYLAALVLMAEIFHEDGYEDKLKDTIHTINCNYPYCIDGIYFALLHEYQKSSINLYKSAQESIARMKKMDEQLSFIHSKGYHIINLVALLYFHKQDYAAAFRIFSTIEDETYLKDMKIKMIDLKNQIETFLENLKHIT